MYTEENIPCAKFVKSKCANQPEKFFTEEGQREAIHKSSIDQTQDVNLNYMWKVARFMRKEILYRDQWVFTGTVDDFDNAPKLHTLLKWILLGTSNHVENETGRKGIDRSTSVACQYIIQSTKTSRQVNYKPQENVTRNREISCTVERPLNVGTCIYIYQKTRCRELIDILSDLNISTDYDKLLNIKSQLADTVLTEVNNNDDVFITRSISKDLPIYFSIDKTDLKIDTPDGRNQLHGTAIAVYQKKKLRSSITRIY